MRWKAVVLAVLVAGLPWELLPAANEDILCIARSYADGGKYQWKGSGTPEAIYYGGEVILPAGDGTYCSGFTFAVVMRAARERGLLSGKSIEQIRAFQKNWYGATKASAEVQAGYALQQLGIGGRIKASQAQPGDFVQLWRTNKSGHSVIFLHWIVEDGKKIGLRYRSTQEATGGIGERAEYFSDVPGRKGEVLRSRTYVARLHPHRTRGR